MSSRGPGLVRDEVCAVGRDISLRARLESVRPEELNLSEVYFHRPCSTQLTGMITGGPAGTRKLAFSTRFCLAPTISSPSTSSSTPVPVYETFTCWTTPASPTSSTIAVPASSASSRRSAAGPAPMPMMGTMEISPIKMGLPGCTLPRRTFNSSPIASP